VEPQQPDLNSNEGKTVRSAAGFKVQVKNYDTTLDKGTTIKYSNTSLSKSEQGETPISATQVGDKEKKRRES